MRCESLSNNGASQSADTFHQKAEETVGARSTHLRFSSLSLQYGGRSMNRVLFALAAFSVVTTCTYQSTDVTAGSAEQPAVVPESTTTVQEQFEQPAPAVEPSTTVMAATKTVQGQFEQPAPAVEPSTTVMAATTTVPDSAAPASTAPEANEVSFEGLNPEQQEAVDLVCRYAETGSGDRLLIVNMILSGGTGVTAWEDNIGPTLRDASSPDEVGTARKQLSSSCADLGWVA